jgi:hypothetical protein
LFNHLRFVVLALALMVGAISFTPTPASAQAEGLCIYNNWPSNLTGQWYYQQTTSVYFDHVYGYLTDRKLYPCEGLSYQGWSFAAAANVQGGGKIFQLGLLQEAGNAGDQNYFVYTEFSGSGQYVKLTSVRPVLGNRYQFHIWKNSNGKVAYSIATTSGSIIWQSASTTSYPTNLNLAWWGYETANSKSQAGINPGASAADLVGLWSTSSSSTLNTETNITPLCTTPVGNCHFWADMLVSGGNNEIFNVRGYLTFP